MPSVTLALSAFWRTEALISCSEAVVSSTLAACWLAPMDRLCEVWLTCSEAALSSLAAVRTSEGAADGVEQVVDAAAQPREELVLAFQRNALRQVALGRRATASLTSLGHLRFGLALRLDLDGAALGVGELEAQPRLHALERQHRLRHLVMAAGVDDAVESTLREVVEVARRLAARAHQAAHEGARRRPVSGEQGRQCGGRRPAASRPSAAPGGDAGLRRRAAAQAEQRELGRPARGAVRRTAARRSATPGAHFTTPPSWIARPLARPSRDAQRYSVLGRPPARAWGRVRTDR
jgi:hypothetical protein